MGWKSKKLYIKKKQKKTQIKHSKKTLTKIYMQREYLYEILFSKYSNWPGRHPGKGQIQKNLL